MHFGGVVVRWFSESWSLLVQISHFGPVHALEFPLWFKDEHTRGFGSIYGRVVQTLPSMKMVLSARTRFACSSSWNDSRMGARALVSQSPSVIRKQGGVAQEISNRAANDSASSRQKPDRTKAFNLL